MAAIANLSRFQADSVAKLGQLGVPLDIPIGSQYDYPKGIYNLAYEVPVGKRFLAKAMSVSIRPNELGPCVLNSPNIQRGLVSVAINGTTVAEYAYHGFQLLAYAGCDEQQDPFQQQNGSPSFGEGVIVPAGQTILIRCSPGQATLQVWRVTLFGKLGTTANTQSTVVQTYLTTANQTLLSYTPPSNYTIIGITMESDQPGHIYDGLQMDIGGAKCFEAGYIGLEGGTSTFMDDKSYAGPGQGCLLFPLWGITFGEGSRFGYTPSACSDHGMHLTHSVFGNEETVGGGGSTGTMSYAF